MPRGPAGRVPEDRGEDFELLEEAEFRALLEALNFEAPYDPQKKELAVKVVLAPELTGPNDGRSRSSLSLVPPGGVGPDLRRLVKLRQGMRLRLKGISRGRSG
jgi:hypothetical protein